MLFCFKFPSHLQDKTICSLKKKNQELEKLKFVSDFQLNQLRKETELQHDDIHEKKEQLHQVCVCDQTVSTGILQYRMETKNT